MIEVGFAQISNPLFLGNKNFGTKLDVVGRNAGLKMLYDQKERELIVTWQGFEAHFPNIEYYCPIGKTGDRKVAQVASPMVAGVAFTAQVETPMSHVHAGHGHGKTGTKSK